MDARVLAFALFLATVATLLAGLGPALQASRRTLVEHLREGGRDGAALGSRRTPRLLVAAEVALALMLLDGRRAAHPHAVDDAAGVERGFDPANVAMMTVSLPARTYQGRPMCAPFYARLLERVRTLPGVTGRGERHRRAAAAGHYLGHLHRSKASRCRRPKSASSIRWKWCRRATSRPSA